jgi:AcrR family transcriptional regulator
MDPAEALAQIPPETPRDVRRPHVEAQLIATMERLIATGFAPADISIGRLAREAGIGRATFYLYFPDRQAFNLRLVDYLREALTPALEQLWAAVTGGGWASADEAALTLLRTYRKHGPIAEAVSEAAAVDAVLAARLQEGMNGLIELTEKAIDAGKQANVIRREIPSAETAAILVWTAERMCSQLAPNADDDQLDRLVLALKFLTRDSLIQG